MGEVLEQDVDRLDVGTLELLASQRGSIAASTAGIAAELETSGGRPSRSWV